MESQTWLDPIEVRLSLSKQKFASGACRDAFMATGLTCLSGKMVLQKYCKERQENIANLFTSVEEHTRKTAQMHSFARHLTKKLCDEAPITFGKTSAYTK